MASRRLQSLIKFVLLLSSCIYCIESIAVMSVDFGGEFMKIAIVKPGIPMEIVLNKESQRKTPVVVSVRNGERLIGEPALQLSTRFPQTSFKYMGSILGKKFSHPYVKLYSQRFPYYDLAEDPETGGVVYKIKDDKQLKPEELVAMLLDKAREVAETFAEQPIKDIVVTVPAFYNQAERRAMIRAVQLLDMNLLQLMSDNAAVALNYGVFRRKAFNSTAQVYMFYDMGATSTTASIVSYQVVKMKDRGFAEDNPQLQILGVGFDQTLGSLAFQLRLRDHLVKAFNEKKKIKKDVSEDLRAMAKLLKEAGRVLKVLSANKETMAQIEGLIEDTDFRHKVTREELETMCADLFDRVSKPVTDAFLASQVTEGEINEVILMGGGTRIPKIRDTLLKVTGKQELGKSINTDEAAAMGAVYQAAYLSKGYKVKRFGVKEAAIYPIQVEFERVRTEDEAASDDKSKIIKRTLFNRMNPFPQKKVMTFNKHQKDFGFEVKYGDLSFLTKDEERAFGDLSLAKVDLSGVTTAHRTHQDAVIKGTKAHFRMDESGIIALIQAESVFEKEKPAEEESTLSKLGSTISNLFGSKEGEEAKEGEKEEGKKEEEEAEKSEEKKEEKKEDAKAEEKKEEKKEEETKGGDKKADETEKQKTDEKADPTSGDEKTDEKKTDDKKEDPKVDEKGKAKNETSKEPAAPKIVVHKENITISSSLLDARDPTEESMKASKAMLDELRKVEKAKVELEKAKNDLEAYILQGRERMYQDEYITHSTEDEREKLQTKFSEKSDWLDEEADTADIDTLRKHLIDLKTETWAWYDRVNEFIERPKLIETMKSMINHTVHFHASIINATDPEDPIFTEVEITTLSRKINETNDWFLDAWKKLNESDPTQKAPFLKDDFAVKLGVLDREIKYLINKAKMFRPKPKPTPAPNTTAANDTKTTTDGKDDAKTEAKDATKDGETEEKKDGEEKPEEKKEEAKEEKKDEEAKEGEPLQLDGADTPKPVEEPATEAPKTETESEEAKANKRKGHDPDDEL